MKVTVIPFGHKRKYRLGPAGKLWLIFAAAGLLWVPIILAWHAWVSS